MSGKGPKAPKVKRHHAFHFLIFICGMLLPPLAVLVRFGVGRDFFINIIMTLCGYFPGHGHNFYLQNIRNNKNRERSPKWAVKYGLVKDYRKRNDRKREWANRYDERLPGNAYDDPSRPHEDEWGNPVGDRPQVNGRTASTASEHSTYEPASARQLDRLPSNASDDTAEFYNPEDARVGSAPGIDESASRHNKGGLRSLVTGTTSRDKKAGSKKDRFAAMEQERSHRGYADYDRLDERDRDGAKEVNPNTLEHTF